MTRMFFKHEVSRRTSDLLSFRSELFTFIAGVGAFLGQKLHHSGSDDDAISQIQDLIAQMRFTLKPLEKPIFDKAMKDWMEDPDDSPDQPAKIFNAFADTILPEALHVGSDFSQHGLFMRAIHSEDILPAADWEQVEAAIPRLMKIAGHLFGKDPEYADGLHEVSETFAERATQHREDMAALEAAIGQQGSLEDYSLPDPAKTLNKRLSTLVTGGIIKD